MNDRVCVYTALFGGYEDLNPQPMARESSDRWICYTDDPNLSSDDWEVVVVEPLFPFDPHRSSRRLKMLGHPLVLEAASSLWIDNSVLLTSSPRAIVEKWLDGTDVAFLQHSYRETVLDEFVVVLDEALDDSARILEQLDHYARSHADVLDERPLWGGMIARRWTPSVDAAMLGWWQQLLRYSRRDQLSLNFALGSSAVDVARLPIDNFESEWHRWPVLNGRVDSMRRWNVGTTTAPPIADLLITKQQLAHTRRELDVTGRELREALEASCRAAEQEKNELTQRLGRAEERNAAMQAGHSDEVKSLRMEAASVNQRVHELQREILRLEELASELATQRNDLMAQLDALRSSRSWKVGNSLARVGEVMRIPTSRRHHG
jgi:hypothetical protein